MAYQFVRNETIPDNVKRVVREEIGSAITELTEEGMDRNEGVHQARKRFKKIRAVLRMVRKEIGDDLYRKENTVFSGFGRQLSAVRDAEAVIETFDKLSNRFPERLKSNAFAGVRENLEKRRDSIADEQENLSERAADVVAGLWEAHERVASWPITNDSFSVLGTGLQKMYRGGQRNMERAYEDPADEQFHEWRKRVKDLWYHSRLMLDIWPELMTGYTTTLHKLSEYLGDDHDLVVFREILTGQPEIFDTPENVDVITEFVAMRQAELRTNANPLGHLIYAEKAKDFNRRIEKYWDVWRTT